MTIPALLAVARGDEPADLLLRNGRIVNVFSGCIEAADIAIFNGRIAGIGTGYQGKQTVNLREALVAPGLIDAHVHIESCLGVPARFAAAVLPHGVTCVVTDPHEIANVAGVAGIRYMAKSSLNLPLTIVTMAPSCVPATHLESNGATLSADDLAALRADGVIYGLAEVMNFPAVIHGDDALLAKLRVFHDRPKDGHAPAVSSKYLNAYVASGIGSDHECTTVAEAQEKLARGLVILVREATNARNLHALLPLITPYNSRRICFCTDDRTPGDLLNQGTVDYMIREAVAFGIDPIEALRMATLNTAEWFGLHDRGAIAPGYAADLVIFDNLHDFRPRRVYANGKLVAENGRMRSDVVLEPLHASAQITGSVNVLWSSVDFRIPAHGTRRASSAPNRISL